MVSVAQLHPQASATPLEALGEGLAPEDRAVVASALAFAEPLYAGHALSTGEPVWPHALGLASSLAGIGVDPAARAAGLLFAAPKYLAAGDTLGERFGAEIAALAAGVEKLYQLRVLTRATAAQQAEALRKMVLGMVEDVRVVLIRLASRTQTLRWFARQPSTERAAYARETLDIYAPLANRLGVWQLKWELEDLSFRFLEPETYKRIAKMLDERRVEREQYIARAMATLGRELAGAGVGGEVSGRPKHIYSICNKMRVKGVDFEQLHDVRALRVIVPEVQDCYAALGVVHNLWQPIEREFDDYISRPKENLYQSLHTAVLGPGGKTLEVQIRTREMHRHAELGVAAHWRYKESGRASRADTAHDDKIAWLRQLLAWRDEVADRGSWAEKTRAAALDDTIYVVTPQGRVVDLPAGATPVDFAYALHTDIGHRCRGAKVDGRIVPLDTALKSGQRVEISVAKSGGPSRDWLNAERGFLKTSRARAKVRHWFNLQEGGRESGPAPRPKLVPAPAPAAPARKAKTKAGGGGILVVGMDRLLTQIARCCKPVPPDAIRGFVTRGRGVSIHRADCSSLKRLAQGDAGRLLDAQWGAAGGAYGVDMVVTSRDRPGLLRDIGDALAREHINVTAVRTQSRDDLAYMRFSFEVADLAQLRRASAVVREVSGVMRVARG
ncbi:MAG: bifunctional (p)ppGpp synthetase/guanosine-3',5'-bis(diphosphate) 3'-pyrophosphohydrolase [Betaproteobacteria bacterium]|nr:bifunctional (p)ppGpp synthetase/guanosine-3',5'-bis(diphosphate) 3'-pyrophosphohydrolase [Betaproteobacteria bacterium]